MPVSVGELFDKITILEIKAERIVGAQAHENVVRQLKLLYGRLFLKDGLRDGQPHAALVVELRDVNLALWDAEDAIRRVTNDIDQDGEIARGIVRLNDKRHEIKRQIDALWQSTITEEKSYA